MPTDRDISCDALGPTLSKIGANLFSRPGKRDLNSVVAELRKTYPEFSREELVDAINTAAGNKAAANTKELVTARFEKAKAQHAIDASIRALQPQSVFSKVTEPLNLARAVMTAYDLSAVGRQGLILSLSHPIIAAKAIGPMLRAFASERSAFETNQGILDRPNAWMYHAAKLFMSPFDGHGPLTDMEEAFMSRLAGKIPLLANSERAYTTFLNKLRADTFDSMIRTLPRDGTPTVEEMKGIGTFINWATGRGSLGSAENWAQGLNTFFFAPRLVASRFELLAAPFTGLRSITDQAVARKAIAKEYARFLVGIGSVYALGKLAGASIEDDPRSSDFGKMRWGTSRLDPLAGLSQATVVLSRLATGESKSTTNGQITHLTGAQHKFGQQTPYDVATSFLRTKLSPWLGESINQLNGKDLDQTQIPDPKQVAALGNAGVPKQIATPAVRAGHALGQLVIPMSGRDIYDAMKAQGVAGGTALGLLAILGFGFQDYGRPTRPIGN
jgi:hypothetical protein